MLQGLGLDPRPNVDPLSNVCIIHVGAVLTSQHSCCRRSTFVDISPIGNLVGLCLCFNADGWRQARLSLMTLPLLEPTWPFFRS
eukprot:695934-Amphidinium_carterae.1